MSTIEGADLPDRYPVSCPQCASVAGVPVAAMTVADRPRALRMDFKCHMCEHQWREEFDAQFRFAACA